jgi:hypothetical protein
MEDSHPRTGKRCENEYRFNKKSNLCHRRQQTPIASHNSRYYPRTGKRCKRTYRYNKSKKLCGSKLFSPSPVGYESYERLGKRCKKSYRHHKPSGLCVYTKKKRRFKINKGLPLPIDRQEEIVKSPDMVESTFDTPVDNSVLYSPESPSSIESMYYSPENSPDNSVLYSPESPKLQGIKF